MNNDLDKTLSDISAEIQEKEKELEKLKKRWMTMTYETSEEVYAKILHKKFCTANHADGCSWYYEYKYDVDGNPIADWSGWAHEKYLKKAGLLKQFCLNHNNVPFDKLIEIMYEVTQR